MVLPGILTAMTNADTAKVDAALDALLAEHDPTTEGYEEFRGCLLYTF